MIIGNCIPVSPDYPDSEKMALINGLGPCEVPYRQ